VFAHDVFPPSVPSGLQAVFAGEGPQKFIDLVWAPDTEIDLAGYNVYRREQGSATAGKINQELVRVPSFRDTNVQPGHEYFYSVSAVDVRGNQSAPSAEASERVP
jgi:fibronectin type 3 domain-containing protein